MMKIATVALGSLLTVNVSSRVSFVFSPRATLSMITAKQQPNAIVSWGVLGCVFFFGGGGTKIRKMLNLNSLFSFPRADRF